ncbi:MAG TPA: glycosyl hydrolase-related protein, partial [Opitutaceae bacterium]|nr:glycosyl hydrolase-related protein [Opitutaceae bacterium]
ANNPLLAVSVLDHLSTKTLPTTHSFVSVSQDSLVISAMKKAERDDSLLLRFYEIEGQKIDATVGLLGRPAGFGEVNLLEEPGDEPGQARLRGGPYEIKTLRFSAAIAAKP